jgi:Uma2 family endonuclease
MPKGRGVGHPATYDDLMQVADHLVAEIVGGELHATPRPALRHALAASSLGAELIEPFQKGRGGPGGWWVLDEPELHLASDVLVPDLAGWRLQRLPVVPDAPFLELPPDWVCEVLSPSTARLDRVHKLAIYARERVPHVWLLDPIPQTLEVFELEGGRWTLHGSFGAGDRVRAVPFEAVDIDLAMIWAGPARGLST